MLGKLKLDPKDPQREMVHLFLTMMAVCHTVIPEEDPKKPGRPSSYFLLAALDFTYHHLNIFRNQVSGLLS